MSVYNYDVIIVGAGAAGLMCAIEAGKRGRRVLIIEQANKPGKKIIMSGGGRCNFTNLNITMDNYISNNKRFFFSALKRYTQYDFIELVEKHKIAFHEKVAGQLFCDNKSQEIVKMLLKEVETYKAKLQFKTKIMSVKRLETATGCEYIIETDNQRFSTQSLVIATGGLSIPSLGSSPFGYKIAEQFGINVVDPRPGLVPLTLHTKDKLSFRELSGVSAQCTVQVNNQTFKENILFTHNGVSGPAILQISSYWNPGDRILIDLLPNIDLYKELYNCTIEKSKVSVKNFISKFLPKSIVKIFLIDELHNLELSKLNKSKIEIISKAFKNWILTPNGTEGYRTAEVTLGGVDCDHISSKTMEAINVPGLYFVGEVLDVTGWLGGYNFQWAWSSGWAAGQYV